MIWKLLAKFHGYAEARDAEDGRLVVFGHGRHFYSWRDAVVAEWRRLAW
jgi:hypothetical protein